VPHAIAGRAHNPYQALPEHLVQSYPSLNEHTVGYGPFWGNGIPEHLRAISSREKKPTSVVSSLSPSVPPMMAVRKLADTVCHRCPSA